MLGDKLKKYILLFSLIGFLLTINNNPNFILLPLLPIIFGFLYYKFIPKNIYIGPCFATMTLVLFFRYILYPIFLKFSGYILFSDYNYAQLAISLMLFELIIIMFVMKNKCCCSIDIAITDKKQSFFLTGILLFVSLALIVSYPSALDGEHWVWESSEITHKIEHKVNGMISQPIAWGKFFIITYLFQKFYRNYKITNKSIYYYLSIVILFSTCLRYSGQSRLSLFIPIVTFIFLIIKTYGAKAQKIIYVVSIFAVVALSFLTLQKNFGVDSVSDLEVLNPSSLFNAYFGGIDNIIYGIKTYENNDSSIRLFFMDSIRNIMGISSLLSNVPSSTSLFNFTIYRSLISADQIPPTITQGLMYFNFIFCFIPTYLMTWVICITDKKIAMTSDFKIAYLLSSFGVIVAWALPGCWMHLTSRFFNYLVPIFLLIFIEKKILKK